VGREGERNEWRLDNHQNSRNLKQFFNKISKSKPEKKIELCIKFPSFSTYFQLSRRGGRRSGSYEEKTIFLLYMRYLPTLYVVHEVVP